MGVLTAGEAPSGAAKAAAALAAAATLATPRVDWSAVGHQPHAQAHNAQPQPCVVLPSPLPSEHPTSNSLRDGQATPMELTGAQETKAAEASGQVASGPMAGDSLPAKPVLVAIGMSTCTVAHPKEEVVGAAAPLPCTEHPEVPGLEGQGLAAGRRKRVPGGHILENPRFQEFLEALRSSSAAIGQAGGRVLRLKQYIGADARPQVIDAVLDALEHNNRVEALYIQNFEKGMFDAQLEHLTRALCNKHIWALNVGENFQISLDAWSKFTERLPETAVAYLYVSEHHLMRTNLKVRMRDAIRENRNAAPRRAPEVISLIGNMWYNPKLPAGYNAAAATQQKRGLDRHGHLLRVRQPAPRQQALLSKEENSPRAPLPGPSSRKRAASKPAAAPQRATQKRQRPVQDEAAAPTTRRAPAASSKRQARPQQKSSLPARAEPPTLQRPSAAGSQQGGTSASDRSVQRSHRLARRRSGISRPNVRTRSTPLPPAAPTAHAGPKASGSRGRKPAQQPMGTPPLHWKAKRRVALPLADATNMPSNAIVELHAAMTKAGSKSIRRIRERYDCGRQGRKRSACWIAAAVAAGKNTTATAAGAASFRD
eukprot:jgi/Tetstr1/445806/TSEL_003519.t1